MSGPTRLRANALGAFVLVVASACGAPGATEVPSPTPKARPADKTEVTMEAIDAGDPSPSPTAAPTAPATASTDPTEDPMIGGVQEPSAEKAVAPLRPRLRACYKKASAVESGIGGTATFDATIGKDGHVSSARFVKREGLNEDMISCLLPVVRAMTFDSGRKSQIIALSFGTAPSSGSVPEVDAGPRGK